MLSTVAFYFLCHLPSAHFPLTDPLLSLSLDLPSYCSFRSEASPADIKSLDSYIRVEPLRFVNHKEKSIKMVADESWFRNLWRTSRKSITKDPAKATIGILAFEVSGLMTKVVNLWDCLSDSHIEKLKEDIGNSFGVKKLVSDDDKYLMSLTLAEMIENLILLATSVANLGKKCSDPAYHQLDHLFDDSIGIDIKWRGWEYKIKKMEEKVKKMKRFAAVTTQLLQELEVLAELEQTLRRMKANSDLSPVKFSEFQKKVMWQRQEVKNLREMSPWIRSYDYIVRLFLRSLFTIVSRIRNVFGLGQSIFIGETKKLESVDKNSLCRSHLFSVYPSENCLPTPKLVAKSDNLRLKEKKLDKFPRISKSRKSTHGSFGGCIPGANEPPFMQNCVQIQTPNSSVKSPHCFSGERIILKDRIVSPFFSKHKLLKPSPSTLGGAGLALHYANLIVLIEKLASAPHLISLDARDDLYNMLPKSVRSILRMKLKLFSKTLASSIYDATLAAEWGLALATIIEWLSPLAHNMLRWHSGHNFEKNHLFLFSEMNTLLVQTLYFANQEKTEAAIVELLMGLNYLSRFGGEVEKRAFIKSASGRGCDHFFFPRE